MPAKHLKNILDEYLKGKDFEEINNTISIQTAWEKIVGKPIGKATTPIKIENNKLYLKCKNPTWKSELQYQKKELLIKINKTTTTIKDIVLI